MKLSVLNEQICSCTRCDLHKGIKNYVPGEGSETARIVFIGEGPGEEEDKQGRPFVGRSGKFLREMIASVGLQEKDYFIANVVKCRPPENRDPRPEEISACSHWLDQQMDILKPEVIVTLGRHSMGRYLEGVTISKVHGRIFKRKDGVHLFPLYHPAVALYSPSQKQILQEDMKRLPILLRYIDEDKR
jgi:DNA polymerase